MEGSGRLWVANSAGGVWIGTASFPLMKVAPISASAAESMTFLILLETVNMGPLIVELVQDSKRGFGDRSLRN